LALAKGEYVQTRNGKEEKVKADITLTNAESYALTIGGIWIERRCEYCFLKDIVANMAVQMQRR
jgi:hypothetical protein